VSTDDLPPRLTEPERLRQLEKKVSTLSVGGGASESTQVEDDDGTLRYEAGLLSDGSYGVRVYDSNGVPISQTGGGGGGPTSADQVSFTPMGTLSSTDVQQALLELDAEKAPAGDATNVPFTPGGNLSATNVDAALRELDLEKSDTTHTHGGGNLTAEVLWEDNDWSRFNAPLTLSYDTGATYTTLVQSDASIPSSGRSLSSAVRRGRVERSGTATTGGNTRLWYLMPETASFEDVEVEVMLYGRTDAGQVGLVLRGQTPTSGPFAGRPHGYVVWHDVVFNLDAWVNVAAWTTSGSGTSTNLVQIANTATGELPGLQYTTGISAYSRTGTTLSLGVPGDHRIQVGDKIDLLGTSIDANSMTVTSLFGANTVIATHPSSGTSSGSSGTVRARRRTMPSKIKVRLEGNVIHGKAWQNGKGEPDWGDPRYSWRWEDTGFDGPQGAGMCGLFVGHLLGGSWVEVGSLKVTAR